MLSIKNFMIVKSDARAEGAPKFRGEGAGAQRCIEFQIFFVNFCSGVCRNLSANAFSDASQEDFAGISNFSSKDKKKLKRSQPSL